MNAPYVYMNPPPKILNPSEKMRRSHKLSSGFIFYDGGFVYSTWRTRLKKMAEPANLMNPSRQKMNTPKFLMNTPPKNMNSPQNISRSHNFCAGFVLFVAGLIYA